jgi:cytidylate kinase
MYDKKLREYKERQGEILTDMRIHSQADEEFYLTANTVLNVARRALEIFKSSELPEKRQLLNFILQNCQLNEKRLEFTLRNSFDKVLVNANQPTLLRIVDKVRTVIERQNGHICIPDLQSAAGGR